MKRNLVNRGRYVRTTLSIVSDTDTTFFKKKKKSAINTTTTLAASTSKGLPRQSTQGAPKNEKKAAKRARAKDKKALNDELDQALAELSVRWVASGSHWRALIYSVIGTQLLKRFLNLCLVDNLLSTCCRYLCNSLMQTQK